MESLYQVSRDNDNAWEGTLVDIGGRLGIRDVKGKLLEIDSVLPRGESGKLMLIWMNEDVESLKREI